MTRGVKFRVWDSRFKNFCKSPKDIVINASSGQAKGVNGGNGYCDHWILSQYTGLIDENGKEIYEGDILAYVFDDGKSVGEIVFKDAAFIVEWKEAKWFSEKLTAHLDASVVIGNIHENPELLGGE